VDYNIISAKANTSNIGKTSAIIKLKIEDEDFYDFAFDNGEQEKEFEVELLIVSEDNVIGDINGDGKINIKDWNKLYNHINETEQLTGDQLFCADINEDGKVNIKDWNRMYDHITEVNPIT
jgi:hypothetical protein